MDMKYVFLALLVMGLVLVSGCTAPSGGDGTGPVCGNGICETGEEQSCPDDCGGALMSPLDDDITDGDGIEGTDDTFDDDAVSDIDDILSYF